MRRLLASLAAAFCGPVAFLIFFDTAHFRWQGQAEDLRDREEELVELYVQAQAATKELVPFRSESLRLDQELRDVREKFLPGIAEPEKEIAWLRSVAEGVGIEVQRLQVSPVRDKEFYVEVPVTFWVEGDRKEILNLIEAIEDGSPLHEVREVGMPWNRQGGNRGFLEVVAFYESPPRPSGVQSAAMTARMPSSEREGKSSRISAVVAPSARLARTVLTGTLVDRTTGSPPQICGSWMMYCL